MSMYKELHSNVVDDGIYTYLSVICLYTGTYGFLIFLHERVPLNSFLLVNCINFRFLLFKILKSNNVYIKIHFAKILFELIDKEFFY